MLEVKEGIKASLSESLVSAESPLVKDFLCYRELDGFEDHFVVE